LDEYFIIFTQIKCTAHVNRKIFAILVVVVVLPGPFRGMEAWRNSTETQRGRSSTHKH